MEGAIYERCFPGKLELVRPVVAEALRSLRCFVTSMTSEDEDDFRLIFTELIVNAVVHGNKYDVRKNVRINLSVNGQTVECFVADEGPGFDHAGLLNDIKLNVTDYVESEHGRGIMLVCSMTDSFAFNERGNEISFKRDVACALK